MNHLKTNYEVGEIPHQEYPRPQFVRDSYLNLNGKWDFAVCQGGGKPSEYNEQILVPFSPESLNSGICRQVLNTADDLIYYNTWVQCEQENFQPNERLEV